MASSKKYLEFVLDQLSELEGVTYRAMMGEYIVYYGGKVVGGIYDDRFLIKPTPSALKLVPEPAYETPYEGAKDMILPDVDDRDLLNALIPAIASDLPEPKRKKDL